MSLLTADSISKTFRIKRTERSLKRKLYSFFKSEERIERSIKALEDVSFSLKKGEILGVIGPNGAGKTTLLKVLSGIYAASSGKVSAAGRVVALLSPGMGLYPQLTGRENLYAFASLYGIPDQEVRDHLPGIIEESGIGEHIDYPVKCYSSGMNMRLSFSSFSLLNPDILLIDEIYQAGDADFQQKSSQRMREMIEKSSAVMFVSHDMHLVKSLCSRALLLDAGKAVMTGPAVDTVNHYLSSRGERLHGTTD